MNNDPFSMAKGNALIQFYHQKDPATLTVEEWATAVNGIMWVLKFQKRIMWGNQENG